VADDHVNRRGVEAQRRLYHVFQQRLAGNGVQYLGQGGFHPRTLARSQDHNFKFHNNGASILLMRVSTFITPNSIMLSEHYNANHHNCDRVITNLGLGKPKGSEGPPLYRVLEWH
jgi:hypothetical protein